MAELSIYTKQMQAMLPQWMKMAKDPTSVGAQFLNVFGVEFEHVRTYLDELGNNQYIDTADIGQIDLTYKIPLVITSDDGAVKVNSIAGLKGFTTYTVKIVSTLREFYSAELEDNVAIVDTASMLVYIRPANSLINADKIHPYDSLTINTATHYEMILHHIWNAFDEFGLLLGIQRLRGERNAEFKARILDVFQNPGNSTKSGLINALSRELDIPSESIDINELADPAFKDSLLNGDGSPSAKLISYADRINKTLGFTWNNMSWDEAYWKSIEDSNMGLDYLPHVWDATMDLWSTEQIQNGIGNGDDLLVRAPEEQSNLRNFKYTVGVRGVVKDGGLVYPEHSFKYKITARGTILSQESRPETYRYMVVASEIIYLYFVVRAFQQYDYLTTIDFSNLIGFRYDSGTNIEVVTGQTIMNPKADPVLKVEAYMETKNPSLTPKLDSLTIKWKDNVGLTNNFFMDTQAHFDRNDSIVQVQKLNTITTPAGSVELGFGDFYHVMNTMGDWKQGTPTNVELTSDGSIQLVTPKL